MANLEILTEKPVQKPRAQEPETVECCECGKELLEEKAHKVRDGYVCGLNTECMTEYLDRTG